MPPSTDEAQPQPSTSWLATPAGRQFLIDLLIVIGIALATLAVYAQVANFDFVNFDDNLYVYDNAHVQAGLTAANIRWAFTAVVSSNWMPVTLLSHMLDVQFFGLDGGMHHLVNVAFHTAAAILLFAFLRRATGARWPSAFVAFVFALHPLHVESVAWISERKDVLSAFFLFLALYAWVRYAERPGLVRYLLVVAPFCLGLMAKPMLVTLPFMLLLLDFWPLRRVQWPGILWEKIPLLALSAYASMVTYWVQRDTGAVSQFALDARVFKALISCVTYIRQTFWPVNLAVFYPYPHQIYAWRAGADLVILLAISAGAILTRRSHPYLAAGWFWYLVTLIPVIGLVQVGEQSHADRYTYLPMVGLTIMLAWGAADVVRKWPRSGAAVAVAATISCVLCMALTWRQAASWRNSETLYQQALSVTADNWLAESNLGIYLMDQPGRRVEAMDHLEAALRIRPDYPQAHNGLGLCLMAIGRCVDAIPHFEAAFRGALSMASPSDNIGTCLVSDRRYADAIPYFEAAIRLRPDSADLRLHLALSLSKIPGRDREAIAQYESVLRLRPGDVEARRNLEALLTGQPAVK